MNFGKFNKERLFKADTASYDYVSLAELAEKNPKDTVYKLEGVYIGTKSQFDPEVPIVAIPGNYVNIPVHQLPEIKEILKDRSAINAINNGEAGFTIEEFFQKRFNRLCYSAKWCNYEEPANSDESELVE